MFVHSFWLLLLTDFLHVNLQLSWTYSFQGISMAPLWDFSKGKFVGVLSALDFILIMREVKPAIIFAGVCYQVLDMFSWCSWCLAAWQSWVKFDRGRAGNTYYICLERSKVLSEKSNKWARSCFKSAYTSKQTYRCAECQYWNLVPWTSCFKIQGIERDGQFIY